MSLKKRIENYLKQVYIKNKNVWVHKSYIEALAKQNGYLADNATRRLRELVAERQIEKRPIKKSTEYRWIPDLDTWLNLSTHKA